jgi:hypothetical protein
MVTKAYINLIAVSVSVSIAEHKVALKEMKGFLIISYKYFEETNGNSKGNISTASTWR